MSTAPSDNAIEYYGKPTDLESLRSTDAKSRPQSWEERPDHDPTNVSPEPYFGKAVLSKKLCIAGLVLSTVFGTCCLVLGIYLSIHSIVSVRDIDPAVSSFVALHGTYRETVFLVLNILITMSNEVCGYIHSVSLRWALQREGRLHFNSNLRLMTNSKSSRPNKWYSNVFMVGCIIMSYTASSLIFLPTSVWRGTKKVPQSGYAMCGDAVIALACGILGQCAVAIWSLPGPEDAPTWSSDPLDTAAACLQQDLNRRPGRCLQSVHTNTSPPDPTAPVKRQRTAYHAHPDIKKVLWLLWVTVLLGFSWGGVVLGAIKYQSLDNGAIDGGNWSLFPTDAGLTMTTGGASSEQFLRRSDMNGTSFTRSTITPSVNIGWALQEEDTDLPATYFIWAFFLICVVQAVLSLALHCTELLVNCSRDEATWRTASIWGLKRDRNVLIGLLTSWQAMILFLLKPIIHWLYGLSLTVVYRSGVYMRPPQIFYLSIGATFLACFATGLMLWPLKGPQPAAFGHLQTLVDLIDDWPEEGKRMFWGHKGEENGIAHAGTSIFPLPSVQFRFLYKGRVC